MKLSDMRAEWEVCKLDDSDKAELWEMQAGDAYESQSRQWYIALLDRAQRDGWIDHPEFRERENWRRAR